MSDLHKPQSLDGKFHGRVFRNRDNQEEKAFVVFVPHDKHLLSVLLHYEALCIDDGANSEQVAAVQRLIARVANWQRWNPQAVKTPDADPGECK